MLNRETLTWLKQSCRPLASASADGASIVQITDVVWNSQRAADAEEMLFILVGFGFVRWIQSRWGAGGPGELRLRVDTL